MDLPLMFAAQQDLSLPSQNLSHAPGAGESQQMTTLTLAAPPAQPQVHSRYLWKHPNREARVTLYADGKVSFAHLSMGRPLQECAPHGSWRLQEGTLHITFHHLAISYKEREHVFLQYGPTLDVWYLTGHFDAANAIDFAFLQPWADRE